MPCAGRPRAVGRYQRLCCAPSPKPPFAPMRSIFTHWPTAARAKRASAPEQLLSRVVGRSDGSIQLRSTAVGNSYTCYVISKILSTSLLRTTISGGHICLRYVLIFPNTGEIYPPHSPLQGGSPSFREPKWLKQAWFPGCHSDIGGSYPEAESLRSGRSSVSQQRDTASRHTPFIHGEARKGLRL